MTRRGVLLLASLVSVIVGCGGNGGSEAEPADLVEVLLSEDDGLNLEMFGPRPTTIKDGTESWYQEPWPACEESSSVDLLGANDLHVYFGDGGDYVYIKEWVSGESGASATQRFQAGTEAFEQCVSLGILEPLEALEVDVDAADIDQLGAYQAGGASDEYDAFIYARNGGVLLLLSVNVFSTESYGLEQGQHLIDVALERLAAIGSVDVRTAETASASTPASTSTMRPTSSTPASTSTMRPTSSSPASTSTMRPTTSSTSPTTPPASATLLTDSLPPLPGYEYVPWSQADIDAYRAGPFYPSGVEAFVEEFAGSDLEHNGQHIGWIELYLLRPEYRGGPDDAVLDFVSGYTYSPGPQTSERVTLAGEQVLVRRTPSLTAWSWLEGGISFTVLANEIDPVEASNFVVALTGTQQAN